MNEFGEPFGSMRGGRAWSLAFASSLQLSCLLYVTKAVKVDAGHVQHLTSHPFRPDRRCRPLHLSLHCLFDGGF